MSFTPAPALIPKANVRNQVASAGSDLLGADITPTNSPSTFRVTVALSGVDSVFNLVQKEAGFSDESLAFNDGVALSAGTIYTFTHGVVSDFSYNFNVSEMGTNISQLLCEEVTGGLI